MEQTHTTTLRSVFARLSDVSHTRATVDDDDICLICRGSYFPAARDGCNPIKLQPCGHVIGHECFIHWLSQGGDATCLSCKREVDISLPLLLKPLHYISHSLWYATWDDYLADELAWLTAREKSLLIAGELSAEDAIACAGKTLVDHMVVSVVYAIIALVAIGLVWFTLTQPIVIIGSLAGAGWLTTFPSIFFCEWIVGFIVKLGIVEGVIAYVVSLALVCVGVFYPKKPALKRD